MMSLPIEVWLLIGGVSLAAILAVLHTLATSCAHRIARHDLRVHVVTLRNEYGRRMKERETLDDPDSGLMPLRADFAAAAPVKKAA